MFLLILRVTPERDPLHLLLGRYHSTLKRDLTSYWLEQTNSPSLTLLKTEKESVGSSLHILNLLFQLFHRQTVLVFCHWDWTSTRLETHLRQAHWMNENHNLNKSMILYYYWKSLLFFCNYRPWASLSNGRRCAYSEHGLPIPCCLLSSP